MDQKREALEDLPRSERKSHRLQALAFIVPATAFLLCMTWVAWLELEHPPPGASSSREDRLWLLVCFALPAAFLLRASVIVVVGVVTGRSIGRLVPRWLLVLLLLGLLAFSVALLINAEGTPKAKAMLPGLFFAGLAVWGLRLLWRKRHW